MEINVQKLREVWKVILTLNVNGRLKFLSEVGSGNR